MDNKRKISNNAAPSAEEPQIKQEKPESAKKKDKKSKKGAKEEGEETMATVQVLEDVKKILLPAIANNKTSVTLWCSILSI